MKLLWKKERNPAQEVGAKKIIHMVTPARSGEITAEALEIGQDISQ